MSYQVLARRWRPRSFGELVGQEHVVKPLVNALDNDRVHHAFLFTGTRGVGKTTVARIFAKSLNCERGVSSTPCGECGACGEVDQGRFVDLIEVDAASRTKVEDTRELLDNVQYAPSRGRYKVYLIDEVHMLSNHSFNALLKTLEEPPPHVKFLLATTDPQRLPVTILSRCLQFSLKRLPTALIADHLRRVLETEGVAFEPAALTLIARAGDGSMRDALSLLDQAIAFAGGDKALTAAEVGAMLGLIDQRQVERLLDALAGGDVTQTLTAVAELDQNAPDYAALLADLLSWLQRIAVQQLAPNAPAVAEERFDPEALRRLAAALSPEEVQLFYQIGLHGQRDLPLAPDPRGGFEMALLRMLCFAPVAKHSGAAQPGAAQPVAAQPGAAQPGAAQPGAAQPVAAQPVAAQPVAARPPKPQQTAPQQTAPPAAERPADWSTLVERLGLTAMSKQLALNCALKHIDQNAITLTLDSRHAGMRSDSTLQRLQEALNKHFGRPLKVKIELTEQQTATPAKQLADQQEQRRQQAVELIHQDPNVQALQAAFDAEVKVDSITPTD